MQSNRLARFALAAVLAAAPLPAAFAAIPAEVHPGMQVVDPAGGTVGMVTGVKGANLILKTDKHEVQVPLASFTASQGKLLYAMTAAQLDAETEKAMVAASAAVAVGAQLYGSDGTLAGQIEAIDDDLVTVKLTDGSSVRIPRAGVAGSAKGAIVGVTTAQLNEAAGQTSSPAAGNGK